ncbi:heme-binding protein [uncultured Desulfuromonas sp.]|uniref:heme-binding protein n=1 Tax=uncultured Desulfuromonas sp. TaxID=181013 RepID=UPI00262AC767|nr:heme-binding protein [uncultured Desulfuromonas sp.]
MQRSVSLFPLILAALLALPAGAAAFEAVFAKTAVDRFEIKTLPPCRVLETSLDGDYFERSGALFKTLFAYIRSHDVSMTVPVEASLEAAGMRFFLGSEDRERPLAEEEGVRVAELPRRTVASHGVRGGYSRDNVLEAKGRLEAWLKKRPEYRPEGEPYAVFWNAPYVPWFLKRFEVHVPIEETEE